MHQPSLSLLTDLYQLTMGAGYWKAGLAEQQACFSLHFRRCPFGGSYAIAAGLADALEYLERLSFDAEELEYPRSLRNDNGTALFDLKMLEYLGDMKMKLNVDAIPEGTAVFPLEPLIRVSGPLLQAQLVETALLNLVNFQTLIATKSARICRAATGPRGPEPVLEFGLRRAQGVDGALSASRAAYIGGCAATSNVLAGKRYGIPVKGTHAHSWVMTFGDELEAFEAYARAFPDNCVFLVDTYDTLEGVRRAIEVGKALRAKGHEMTGVRLDSGDLAELSRQARVLLDAAGFEEAAIVASNDLDEHRIVELKKRGAEIRVWGVGTRLCTAYDQPALGGVYKLAATRDEGEWERRIKLSNTPIKISIPGLQQTRRYYRGGKWVADAIWDELLGFEDRRLVHPETGQTMQLSDDLEHEELLSPMLREGARVDQPPSLSQIRDRAKEQLATMPEEVSRLADPASYFVGLEGRLATERDSMVRAAKEEPRS